MALLQSGKVLLTQFGYFACCDAELFDPATGLINRIPGLRASGVARVLPDGRVVMVDQYDVSVYRIEQDVFQIVAKQSLGGSLHGRAVAVLSNGNVLIAGGQFDYPCGVCTDVAAYVYDPYRNTLKRNDLPQPQQIRGMVNLADGSVITTGGDSADFYSPEEPASPLVYNSATRKFQEFPLPYGSSAVQLLDGRLLFVGGSRWQVYSPTPRVVSSASLTGGIAAGSLATLLGSQLSGIALEVVDLSGSVRPVRQIANSSARIDFLMPPDVTLGRVTLRQAGSGRVFAEINVNYVAPTLFTREHDLPLGYFTRADSISAIRGGVVIDERPTYLTLYGTGIRNRTTVGNVTCTIGGVVVGVDYAGADGGGVSGLDQVNVRLPDSLRGRGIVDLRLKVDGVDSDTVTLEFL
jgi:uncharacterized protein (TIGR03437 family)